MTRKRAIYRCSVCGNTVEVLNTGAGTMACCGQPMQLLMENVTDAAHEKHVPVVEKTGHGYRVKVGSTEHPMLDSHYIQWIELHTAHSVLRQELEPGGKPEAIFQTDEQPICAREYCNLHGLWKGELKE